MPARGCFYPPTLITGLDPAAETVQEEIFGPVLVSLTFRTPAEAIELANNTRYGLAASVWSDNINLALDVASKLKAGSVWVNSTNLFDAASGFGGYRESGFGREGGQRRPVRVPAPGLAGPAAPRFPAARGRCKGKLTWGAHTPARPTLPTNGKGERHTVACHACRPHAEDVHRRQAGAPGWQLYPRRAGPKGRVVGQVGDGNRKDIRDAVEAAHAAHTAKAWLGDAPRLQPLANPVLHRREPGCPPGGVCPAHRRR